MKRKVDDIKGQIFEKFSAREIPDCTFKRWTLSLPSPRLKSWRKNYETLSKESHAEHSLLLFVIQISTFLFSIYTKLPGRNEKLIAVLFAGVAGLSRSPSRLLDQSSPKCKKRCINIREKLGKSWSFNILFEFCLVLSRNESVDDFCWPFHWSTAWAWVLKLEYDLFTFSSSMSLSRNCYVAYLLELGRCSFITRGSHKLAIS